MPLASPKYYPIKQRALFKKSEYNNVATVDVDLERTFVSAPMKIEVHFASGLAVGIVSVWTAASAASMQFLALDPSTA
jgi:hypothetical protein